MSTHRSIDRLCAAAAALALLLTLLGFLAASADTVSGGTAMDYENRIFDTSYVHTIDILIDDWEGFLATAQSEEYTLCSAVIDGETFSHIGIRGKGNTSLSTVASMDSDRYSFKLEFDQYTSGGSYYGLDKLSLNNLIQDNTCMKDYLTYRMMAEFGAAAPLCSFVWITVNSESWGLYLAVEAVEEAFLQRNYGSDYGELYKPDSMNMGGGRGNGQDFRMDDFLSTGNAVPQQPSSEGFAPGDFGGQMPGGRMPGSAAPQGGEPAAAPPDRTGQEHAAANAPQMGGGMGGDDAKLQYLGDDPASYSTIFDSAKTDVSAADQARLIRSLKALSSGDIEASADVDALLRYFVVHNYVVNGDSYTGSMIHNYYLYEEEGLLSMIPWDYNLAFGTFQGSSADSAVNDPIDAPLSVTGSGDRPMIDWIFRDEAYTASYHAYFSSFLQTVDVQAIISHAAALIAPYVQQDPTAFCSYAEFEQGVAALQEFCALRSESLLAQLSGSDVPVDASHLDLSDMGTMNMGKPNGSDMGSRGSGMQNSAETHRTSPAEPQTASGSGLILSAVTAAVLAAGLAIALLYRRR